jgi:putative ABC transport system permease protein
MMFDLDKWEEIFATMRQHKLRTLLTAFGVFWGIFLLVMLLGIGRGIENGVFLEFSGSATNSLNVWSEETSVMYQGLPPKRSIHLTNQDINLIQQVIPKVQYINANAYLPGVVTIRYHKRAGSFPVQGVLPEFIRFRSLTVTGRFLNLGDMTAMRKVAVIGKQVAQVLFEGVEPMGKYISIDGSLFQVVGLFDVDNFDSDERATERIYIPLATLQHLFNHRDYVDSLNIVVDPNIPVAMVKTKVMRLLRRRHLISPDDIQAVAAWDASKTFIKLQKLFQGVRMFLWMVGTGTLLAGIVGVGNIMLIVVKERTREIGLRKALGATPFSIVSLIVQEAIFITALSGYSGLVAGVGLLEGISYLMEKLDIRTALFARPGIEMPVALGAIVVLTIAGTAAGFIPAINAVKINPIEALRSE